MDGMEDSAPLLSVDSEDRNDVVVTLSDDNNYEVDQFYRFDPLGDPHAERSFVDALPPEIVLFKLWPILMRDGDALQKFRICTQIRMVCRGWKQFVQDRREWREGMTAWENRPFGSPSDETRTALDYDSSDIEDDGMFYGVEFVLNPDGSHTATRMTYNADTDKWQ